MTDEIIGQKLRYMSQSKFETITEADNELYAVNGSGIGFPSNKFDELTLGASGTDYIAPANGYFYIEKQATAATQYITIIHPTRQDVVWSSATYVLYLKSECFKGETVKINYTASGTTYVFRFIYAVGE